MPIFSHLCWRASVNRSAIRSRSVASAWTEYFDEFLKVFGVNLPEAILSDPFSKPGAIGNLPAVGILLLVTAILVIGIRESAYSNTLLVIVKLGVVLFVIAMGIGYVTSRNWTDITPQERKKEVEASLREAITEFRSTFQPSRFIR